MIGRHNKPETRTPPLTIRKAVLDALDYSEMQDTLDILKGELRGIIDNGDVMFIAVTNGHSVNVRTLNLTDLSMIGLLDLVRELAMDGIISSVADANEEASRG